MKKVLIETSMLKLMMQGNTLILCSNKPIYSVDEILGVKETFRYEAGDIYYASEEDVKPGDYEAPGNEWRYGNALPEIYIKRYVKVSKTTVVSRAAYDTVLNKHVHLYNKRAWIIPCLIKNLKEFKTIYETKTVFAAMSDKVWLYELKLI